METQELKYLFAPLKIGNITIPNRIVNSAHSPRLFPVIAEPNERAINYYEARAKGGIGLIITAGHHVSWPSTIGGQAAMENDNVIPAMKRLADAVHQYDTKVFCQLMHYGNLSSSRSAGGGALFSASAVPRQESFRIGRAEIPYEMDADDIKKTVEAYGGAARRAKDAGYDGIEIAAMFGMLQASFLSPAMNYRSDQYGGSLENRMRFLLETIDSVRDNVGPDFVLGLRFSGDELMDGGITLDDTKEIAKRLEATGKIDYLFPCAGGHGPAHVPPMYYPLGAFVYLAAAIKEVVNLPVFCVGRINDPVLADRILADNQADMVAMTRATICDPEMPNKAREGRLDDIRRCIGCLEGCLAKIYEALPLTCAINPEAGREKQVPITPADVKKRVMVIGGGAAGLETARVAALRGHKVSLYEKENVLAKELTIAAKAPGREDFEEAVRYFAHQMTSLGVDIHLGVTVTPEMALEGNYDAVVVATGALPYIPSIPGADAENVVEMREVLQGEVEVGQNVVVVDLENHIYGIDTAEFLADRGKSVELLTKAVHAGGQLDYYTLETAYTKCLAKGVVITPLTRVKEINGSSIVSCNVLTGIEKRIEGIDTIVFATDGMADNALYRSLKGKVKELYQVGQCVSPRKMLDSVHDGFRVGRAL